jgi:hypothetical protein
LIVGVLSFRAHAPVIRAALLAGSVFLLVVLFWLSYFVFCVGCT